MKFIRVLKRQKFVYYITHIFIYKTPAFFYHSSLKKWLTPKNKEVEKRLEYYISSDINYNYSKEWIRIGDFKRPKKGSMYFFDLVKITKYFKKDQKINFAFGDITETFESPTLVKSRPIVHNGNSILMKLNSLRHFNFIEDSKKFSDKDDMIVWRGEIHKENRRLLLEKFHDHPNCDIGYIGKYDWAPNTWKKDFLSIKKQLNSKFILSIEGNDVATNLKWIMSSNSLCLMPKPKFETWYMEGLLIPDFHYVLIKDDYSYLLEKRAYYIENPNEALKIIKNAKKWTMQFQNSKIEKELSIKVLNRFFKLTNQN
ncbi:MAG TPA: lipopolysaccharide A protein [Tenacibaculum sp.]|nr:lipopolysaccharide A protein [Tenacibaculum sp.]